MAVISFDHGGVWKVARWAFQNLLEMAMRDCDGDEPARDALFSAIAVDGLNLPLGDRHLEERLLRLLVDVAEGVLRGRYLRAEVEGHVLDQSSQDQFASAVRELLAMLRHEVAARNGHPLMDWTLVRAPGRTSRETADAKQCVARRFSNGRVNRNSEWLGAWRNDTVELVDDDAHGGAAGVRECGPASRVGCECANATPAHRAAFHEHGDIATSHAPLADDDRR